MKITSIQAQELLESEKQNSKNSKWIVHCLTVGNSAGRLQKH